MTWGQQALFLLTYFTTSLPSCFIAEYIVPDRWLNPAQCIISIFWLLLCIALFTREENENQQPKA